MKFFILGLFVLCLNYFLVGIAIGMYAREINPIFLFIYFIGSIFILFFMPYYDTILLIECELETPLFRGMYNIINYVCREKVTLIIAIVEIFILLTTLITYGDFLFFLTSIYLIYFSLISLIASKFLGSKRNRFLILLCGFIVISITLTFVLFHYILTNTSGGPLIPLKEQVIMVSLLVWISVCLTSLIGIFYNSVFSSFFTKIFVALISKFYAFWSWIKDEEMKGIRYSTIPVTKIEKVLRRFIYCFIEMALANIWFILLFIKEGIDISESPWTNPLLLITVFSLFTYPFFIMERKRMSINGHILGPNILHKLWSILTIIVFLKQIITLKPDNIASTL